ncbi:MAG: DsbE family thiol:disulfide interchange protein [Motiliproteus sp.]|nr:DsbE family thiol:disulfide interchange protein [Motiliproteus sp.]MCW9053091.1 DsbE family thiol:disulfide interchange protein [Motiliproteus sp.]
MNTRRLLLFIPLLIAIGLGVFLWKGLSLDPRELPSALIDKPFPEFEMASLQDPDRQLTREDLVGEPSLVNVWATWCPSCKIEHPVLMNIAKKEGVKIYGVNYKDEREAAKEWLQQYRDPYVLNIYDDEGRLGFDLGVYGAPETYVLDAKGVIRYRHAGPVDQKTWIQLKGLLDELRSQG